MNSNFWEEQLTIINDDGSYVRKKISKSSAIWNIVKEFLDPKARNTDVLRLHTPRHVLSAGHTRQTHVQYSTFKKEP